jgi:hypothetical protein
MDHGVGLVVAIMEARGRGARSGYERHRRCGSVDQSFVLAVVIFSLILLVFAALFLGYR